MIFKSLISPYTLEIEPAQRAVQLGVLVVIDGLKAVSRETGRMVNAPRQFVVTRKVNVWDKTISIYPGIRCRGKYRTTQRKPKIGAAISLWESK